MITYDEVSAGLKQFDKDTGYMAPEMKYQEILQIVGPEAEHFIKEALLPALTLGETMNALRRIENHLRELGVGNNE